MNVGYYMIRRVGLYDMGVTWFCGTLETHFINILINKIKLVVTEGGYMK